MSKTILFVTGNAEKVRDARYVAKEYDVTIEQITAEIDEIQHHDPLKIAEHKTKAAYELLKKPVVVNDSFWSIPALGGFPGGYMKDVNGWFQIEDFMNLMKDKKDKTVVLTDVNGYFDGTTYNYFKVVRPGKFIDQPRGESGPPFAHLVVMDGEGKAISEVMDEPDRTIDSNLFAHWHELLSWYVSQ